MKQYDSINYFGDYWGLPIIAFDKMDGSNLRFEYSHKRGFYKFGTRKQMIDERSEFGFAINLFLEKYNESLSRIFRSKEYRNILSFVCYAELVGSKSAFGQHEFGNDTFDVVLFDVDRYKKGFVPPKEFMRNFGDAGIPRIVYEGNLNKDLVARVKANEFNLSEGVICKGDLKDKNGKLYYCKIKTDDWFQRLRSKDTGLYEKELLEVSRTNH